MKSRLIIACTIFALLLPLCACALASNAPVPEQVSVDASYAGKEVELADGGSLTVTLECNPKIGLEWALRNISDQTTLKLVNQKFKPPEESGTASEGNAQEIWSFKAIGTGKSTIYMEYRQPWQKQFPPEKTFSLIVVVK